MHSYYQLDTILNILHDFLFFILMATKGRCFKLFHFTDEETKIQRDLQLIHDHTAHKQCSQNFNPNILTPKIIGLLKPMESEV